MDLGWEDEAIWVLVEGGNITESPDYFIWGGDQLRMLNAFIQLQISVSEVGFLPVSAIFIFVWRFVHGVEAHG